jgi:CheY-specific phosphatase CheX
VESTVRSSFVAATKLVLGEIGFPSIRVRANIRLPSGGEGKDILAMIGIVGALRGHFMLRFSERDAITFVEHLSGHLGMHGEDPNDPGYRKAAIGEIANQLGGRAVAVLADSGIDCMVTPPTVITGANIGAALPESDDRSIFSASGSFGRFHCIVAIKNSKSL